MPKTKAKAKAKAKPAGPKGLLYAIKGARVSKNLSWMPDEVIVLLEGEKTGRLLMNCGWTGVGGIKEAWPVARIESNLAGLVEGWVEDFGRGWRLEVRPL